MYGKQELVHSIS